MRILTLTIYRFEVCLSWQVIGLLAPFRSLLIYLLAPTTNVQQLLCIHNSRNCGQFYNIYRYCDKVYHRISSLLKTDIEQLDVLLHKEHNTLCICLVVERLKKMTSASKDETWNNLNVLKHILSCENLLKDCNVLFLLLPTNSGGFQAKSDNLPFHFKESVPVSHSKM